MGQTRADPHPFRPPVIEPGDKSLGVAAGNLPFTGDYVRLYDMEDWIRGRE